MDIQEVCMNCLFLLYNAYACVYSFRSPGTGVASETISGSRSALISTVVARQFLNNLKGDISPM